MRHTADVGAALALGAAGAGFLRAALAIPGSSALWNWYDAPGLAPAVLSGVLLLQAAVLLARGLRRERVDCEESPERWWQRARAWGLWRVLGAVCFCTAFVALVGRVPFGLLVAALVSGMTYGFRGTDALRAALLGVITAVSVQLVFGRLFFVPLP